MKKLTKGLKKAFTITELVIVIAVIAILAAVLIPTFSSVIGSARESAAMQECRNALTDLSAELETTGGSTTGMVLTNKDYVYVNLNGNLHRLENINKNAYFTHSGEDITLTNGDWLTEEIEGVKISTYVTGFAAGTYNTEKETKKGPDEGKDLGIDVTITNAEVNGGGTSKPLNIKLEANENLYLYTIEDNNTTYLGYFTLEMNDAKNTKNNGTVVYSTRFGYVAIDDGAKIAFANPNPGIGG